MDGDSFVNNSGCEEPNIFHPPVVVISMTSSILSILGSCIIVGTYFFIPDVRNSTRNLLLCLTVADFLTALGCLISTSAHFAGHQEKVCFTQSVITTYSSLVSFNLTVAIATHLFLTVIFQDDRTSTVTFLFFVNVISWIVPAFIVEVAAYDGALGVANSSAIAGTGPWCWLKSDHHRHTFWVFFAGKGWEILCYLLTFLLHITLECYSRRQLGPRGFSATHETLRDEDHNYLYVWIVLLLLRLWGTIRSMMSLDKIDDDCHHHVGHILSEVLLYMQAFGDPGQAFCNCILFCLLDKTVRKSLFGRCIRRMCNGENGENDRLMDGFVRIYS